MSITTRALWYVESHLHDDLSLDAVASAVGVSRFHLSRAFSTRMGRSLVGYARARRLTQAALALAAGAPDILALALDAGYGSHEAFTRAFSQQFGATPEQVRDRRDPGAAGVQAPVRIDQPLTSPLDPPRIVRAGALRLFGLGQRYAACANVAIPAQWGQFVASPTFHARQPNDPWYGVIYNTDDSADYDYLCGVQVGTFPATPAEFTRLTIPAQSYAVFHHRQHISAIASTWLAIWDSALSDAGHSATDGAAFERYDHRFDGRTGDGGLEVWVPIEV